jgi:hypothetical protein
MAVLALAPWHACRCADRQCLKIDEDEKVYKGSMHERAARKSLLLAATRRQCKKIETDASKASCREQAKAFESFAADDFKINFVIRIIQQPPDVPYAFCSFWLPVVLAIQSPAHDAQVTGGRSCDAGSPWHPSVRPVVAAARVVERRRHLDEVRRRRLQSSERPRLATVSRYLDADDAVAASRPRVTLYRHLGA